MSITVNIKDPQGCRLTRLMRAIVEYMSETGNMEIGVNMDLTFHKSKKAGED